MSDDKFCDVCGKNITGPLGDKFEGVRFSFNVGKKCTSEYEQFALKQIEHYMLDHDYYVCFACTLRAQGIKPNVAIFV